MEELFANNLFAIYMIACLAVISYTNFNESQRMLLLYVFTYGTALFNVFQIFTSVSLLLIITFIFLEYLSADAKKLELIVKIPYKALDYFYLMFFQYSFLWVLLSFLLLFSSRIECDLSYLKLAAKIMSVLYFCAGIHQTVSQPFKIKNITEIFNTFQTIPPHKFEYHKEMQAKFDLLCAFEDKSYFSRDKSYSCFSYEYFKYILKRHSDLCFIDRLSCLKQDFTRVSRDIIYAKRGFSTPEMQLMRTIGVVRGYDKYKVQRKIFEIIYSKIFFSSLKEYHKANTHLELTHYRHYLLYVYLQTVLTRIKGQKYFPLSSAFVSSGDISNWSMHGLFIVCLGLSFRKVSDANIELYHSIIDEFKLDCNRIRELNNRFPDELFPSEEN